MCSCVMDGNYVYSSRVYEPYIRVALWRVCARVRVEGVPRLRVRRPAGVNRGEYARGPGAVE